MPKIKALSPSNLCATCPAERIPWQNSDHIPRSGTRRPLPQPRALKALELALQIEDQGYNVYLSGSPNLGRTYMLREFLTPRAAKADAPPDLLYVNNFEEPDKPKLITLPAGQGRKFRAVLAKALQAVRKELPSLLENNTFVKRRGEIQDKFHKTRSKLLREMNKMAVGHGFNLDMDEQGSLTLYPLVEGKRINEEEFERLDSGIKQGFKQKSDLLLRTMSGMVRKLNSAEQVLRSDERGLDREAVAEVLEAVLRPVIERTTKIDPDNEGLQQFFSALQNDILENPDYFLSRDQPPQTGHLLLDGPVSDESSRYDVNVFVDNSQQRGAPVIVESHPTSSNLLGNIERESEMGALVTDFTLIKAGSLHKANGGFLVINVEDILQHPQAWEGLLRALRSGFARFEENTDGPEMARTKGIEPEALPLRLKVILVGDEGLYETLLVHDPRFFKLFKIKAHMSTTTERTASTIRAWLVRLARIIDEAKLLTFTKEALAGLVEHGSRLIDDQRKLSLMFPVLKDVMIEATALARRDNATAVERQHLNAALDDRKYRASLVEELYMEEYDREMIKVRTSGEAVGRVNGLSVTWYGDFEFGLPHQISCTVGVGHGGIIDLEREAELGGPIHTKAMLILKSYLVDQFARNKPLVLTGSLCFEQNYAGVEGDSASGAELAALLSAISEVPLRLSLAFTGAVSQSGQIMAVGGVSRKIEGFFNVCKRRGLSGQQGVIIPYDNVDHLMLPPEIVEAVSNGLFAIYPVNHINEALELLTGMTAGRQLKNGSFSKGSLYALVDQRLHEMGRLADHAYSKPLRRPRGKAKQ